MTMTLMDRARAYLAKLPIAVENDGGQTALFRAAKVLVVDFDLSDAEALTILREFNARCLPPFSERDLRAKLASARKDARGQRGRLKETTRRGGISYHAKRPSPPPPALTGPTLRQIMQAKEEAAELARKRAGWPDIRITTDSELQQIATLRGVRFEVVRDLAVRRFLMACTHNGRESFALCGRRGTFRQLKHFDGSRIRIFDRMEKAKALPGSRGGWIDEFGRMDGDMQLPAGFPVLIVEGVIGILEAMEARHRADDFASQFHRALIIARISATQPATRPLLKFLEGRKVRIIADDDPSGIKYAKELHVMTEGAGAFPDIILPPSGKDLGDSLAIHPADDPDWREIFTF